MRKYLTPILIFFLLIILALYTVFSGGGSRAADITIFNPTDKWVGLFERRYEAVFEGFPNSQARFFNNKPLYVTDRFINNFATYVSPQFLFTQGPNEWTYGMIPGRGVLYLFEILFVIASVWFLVRYGFRKSRALTLIIVWLLIAIIPAALTKGSGFAGNRAATMMPALQILSSFGALVLWTGFRNRINNRVALMGAVTFSFIIFISFLYFLEDYRFHAPRGGAEGMLFGRKEAVEFAAAKTDNYEQIIFSRSLSEPQIFVAFFSKWDPADYQKESTDWLRYEDENLTFVDQLGTYNLGKYIFKNITFNEDAKIPGVLLIGKPDEFPHETPVLKTIYLPNKNRTILIFDPMQQDYAEAIE